MPNIRHTPKWLAFLVPISLALLVMGAPGCSSNDDAPVPPRQSAYSPETGIASIAVNMGTLYPPYSDDVRNYSVGPFYAEASDFSLTVTLKDPRSKLTINGESAASGRAFPVSLPEGLNSIQIAVEGEDGRSSNLASLTATVMKLNTTVYVYDSIAGNLLDGDVRISLRDALTNELLAKDIAFPMEAQGTVFLGLDKNRRYNIYARRSDTAMACFADFDPSREDTLTLYSRRDWAKDLPASAPIVTDVAFAYAVNDYNPPFAQLNWKSMPPGANHIADTAANLYYLKVTVIAESNIIMTRNAGSISVNIDDMPFINTGGYPSPPPEMSAGDITRIAPIGYWEYANAPVVVDGKRYVKTDMGYRINAALASGEHFLDIVIYDWANNRTEQKVYFNVTSAPAGADPDISTLPAYRGWYAVRARTYGMPLSLYSKEPRGDEALPLSLPDPVGPNGDTVTVQFEYYFQSGFRGWELHRATSPDGPFKIARRRSFATPQQVYVPVYVMDTSAELTGGVTYYYYFRFFNNISEYSSTVYTVPTMPSFNINLVSPANQAVSNTLWPTFSFRVSNDSILDKGYVDYGRFTLYVRNKIGEEALKARFQVDYNELDEEGAPAITINWPYGGNWYYVYEFEADEDGNPIMDKPLPDTAFVWIEDDGAFVIDTSRANDIYGEMFKIVSLEPGVAYEWDIFGDYASAGNGWSAESSGSMFFTKALTGAANSSRVYSYSSNPDEGSGAVNGYFTLIMHPNAE